MRPWGAVITALIIDLAHRFGLSVVAEGVEDEATFAALAQRGCDVVQGHHFGAAMGSAAFAKWLAQTAAQRTGAVTSA